MAKRTFQQATWRPAAIADTTALATAQFMSPGAANTTQLLKVIEIYIAVRLRPPPSRHLRGPMATGTRRPAHRLHTHMSTHIAY